MKPVLILQHLPDDGPAYLLSWLTQQGQAVDLRHTSAGDGFPPRIEGFAALAVLGGEWSANDERPSLRQAEHLIRQAVAQGVPVLGHCLGGQLMSRALGAAVGRSPQAERGWHRITRLDHPAAHHWLGDNAHPVVFQWHGEAFALPDGAILLASSTACPHQAWCLGPHLAMQFHIEVDEHKLAAWAQEIDNSSASAQAHSGPFWQGVAALREGSLQHLPASQRLADRIYSRWLAARVP